MLSYASRIGPALKGHIKAPTQAMAYIPRTAAHRPPQVWARMQRLAQLALCCVPLAASTASCDAIAHWRDQPGGAAGSNAVSTQPPPGRAGLEVKVEPPTGMTVRVDGNIVGHTSPLRQLDLAPGLHTLEVRAMGHYPLTLPVTLAVGQLTHVPVSLRPRAPRPFDGPGSGTAAAAGSSSPGSGGSATASGGSGRPQGVPVGARAPDHSAQLWPGAVPVTLHVVAQPPAAITLDGTTADGRSLQLARGQGTVRVGSVQLGYMVRPGQSVDFVVPQDGGQWFHDDTQIKAGSMVRLGRGLLRLRRNVPGHPAQTILMRRLS